MDLNLDEFDLIPIDEVVEVNSPKEEILYDITIDAPDHAFFAKMHDSDDLVLTHNCDASHITAMLIGWFKRFAPNLFRDGKICKLITPLIIVQDKSFKIKEYFFNVQDFKKWEKDHPNNKDKVVYIKGLGSWEREQLQELIDKNGLDKFILTYRLDEKSNELVEDWLGSDPEKRKKHLSSYTFDINAA